jgi:hypothetical protein
MKTLLTALILLFVLSGSLSAENDENWSFEKEAEELMIKEINLKAERFWMSLAKLEDAIESSLREKNIDEDIEIITDTDKFSIGGELKNLTLSQILKFTSEIYRFHYRFDGNILYITKSIHAFLDPVEEFKSDLASGNLYYHTYGYPSDDAMEYEKILQDEYEVQAISYGCCIDELTTSYTRAYNFQLNQYLKKKHGIDVFSSIMERIESNKEKADQGGGINSEAAPLRDTP